MEFCYTVQDEKGNRITQEAKAESISVLVSQLKNQGLLPLQIKPLDSRKNGKSLKNGAQKSKFKKGVKSKDLVVFTRQLASAINSGLLLTEGLQTIRGDIENRHFGNILQEILDYIRSGHSFSDALAKYPKIFSASYVAIIKAGEESGGLNKTLGNLAKYLEDAESLRQKIKSAMFYPAFVVSFAVFVVAFMVFFIIPKFKLIFAQLNFPLPLLTRMVVGVSEFCVRNVVFIVLSIPFSILTFKLLMRNRRIKFSFDRFKLKFFLLGKLIKKAWVARFCRILSILLSGGVGLATSLPISCEASSNLYLREIISQIKNNVLAGSTLTNAFKSHKVFPKMLVKMIQVGEKSGSLSEMLRRNADYYDEELEATLNTITSVIEPCLIIFIGVVVGIVVIAFYLPIFKISTLVSGHH